MNRLLKSASLAVAMCWALAPAGALAQGRGNDHDDDHGRGKQHGRDGDNGRGEHWNPAPPKKNGRYDNRNWNKKWRRDDDDHDGRVIVLSPRPRVDDLYHRRQETKNEWRNLAIAGGVLGAVGLLKHDKTLFFVGTAGALYSLYRYEEDRKSQNQLAHARWYYFSQPYFYRDGHRFVRHKVRHDGEWCYQFVRA